MSSDKIRPHRIQQAALVALEKNRDENLATKSLTVLPSGIGKTHLAAFDAKKLGAKRILFIAHRVEIIEQAESIFRSTYGLDEKNTSISTGFVTSRKKQYDRQMIFATVQTLSGEKTLQEIAKIKFDYVIVDEFHHAAAESYKRVLGAIQTSYVHGLTATPYRLDGKDILSIVDNNVPFSIELEQGIKSGELVPFHYSALYDNIDYSDIQWLGYKYRENDLNKKLIIDRRDAQIIDEYEKSIRATGRQRTIAFCVSVEHANKMAEKLMKRGIIASAITHTTAHYLRARTVQNFRDGKIEVLCVRDIFNEGIDFPEVSAIMLLRPTFSRTVFYQQLGRGLRKAPGKEDVLIYDFVSNYHNAYQVREWLSFASQINVKEIKDKPKYWHNISTVHFDKEVLDIFQLQSSRKPSEYLLNEFDRIVSTIGFIPTRSQLKKWRPLYRKYKLRPRHTVARYERHFGNWHHLVQQYLTQVYHTLAHKLERDTINQGDWIEAYSYKYFRSILREFNNNWRVFRDSVGIPKGRYGLENCSRCGEEFERHTMWAKFCSKQCQQVFNRRKESNV